MQYFEESKNQQGELSLRFPTVKHVFENGRNVLFKISYMKDSIGKFLIISLCWSFSFQILNEIRHLAWDIGYGFDLKISQITGILTIIGSFVLTILFYLIGKNLF